MQPRGCPATAAGSRWPGSWDVLLVKHFRKAPFPLRPVRGLNWKSWKDVVSTQTILVIDDDESLRDTIGVMLEQEGFRPILVADGRAGYEKALTTKPDLALIDLRLPGMSGIEICKQLRAANVKVPIVVLSAVGEEVDKVLL